MTIRHETSIKDDPEKLGPLASGGKCETADPLVGIARYTPEFKTDIFPQVPVDLEELVSEFLHKYVLNYVANLERPIKEQIEVKDNVAKGKTAELFAEAAIRTVRARVFIDLEIFELEVADITIKHMTAAHGKLENQKDLSCPPYPPSLPPLGQ